MYLMEESFVVASGDLFLLKTYIAKDYLKPTGLSNVDCLTIFNVFLIIDGLNYLQYVVVSPVNIKVCM